MSDKEKKDDDLRRQTAAQEPRDEVEEASEQSFPASDPPALTPPAAREAEKDPSQRH